ncbi:MAG TPA: acyltransferase [Mycobacteriales bacterium]|nr:acyltransferase [Mycobacteriales bacterium]
MGLRRNRDPRQARYLTVASLRWVWRNRAFTPWYVVRYWRFFSWRLRNRHVVTEGFIFFGKNVELYARKGFGRLVVGKWVHFGNGNAIRCHEGNLRIGDKCVFGKDNTVNCYLDIEFGTAALAADWVYICDFDHVFDDIHVPIKDQGIVKAPVRIGPDVWIGEKASVLKGVTVGHGSVIASHALVNKDVPPYSVAVGVPARVVRNRLEDYRAAEAKRRAHADIARKVASAADDVVRGKAGNAGKTGTAGEHGVRRRRART